MSSTPVAQSGSWIVRDKDGNPWGPFISTFEAVYWAEKKWPDQEQDEDQSGKGWDVEQLWQP